MRYIWQNPTIVSRSNHAFPNQHKRTALSDEDNSTRYGANTKSRLCLYYNSFPGCYRGSKCSFVHCDEDSQKVKKGVDPRFTDKFLKRKVFVGGLPLSVGTDYLKKYCEEKFGSVEDAFVFNTQDKKGFGFVTFKQEKSASEAIESHHVLLMGTTVEIQQYSEPDERSPQAEPIWLKIFKNWFPWFLKGLSDHPKYDISFLKDDIRKKYGLELDHSSVGHYELSGFLEYFSGGGDSNGRQDPSIVNGGDLKCLEDFSKCFKDLSRGTGASSVTRHREENPSSGNGEIDSAEDVNGGHPRFLQFLKPDPQFHLQEQTDVLSGDKGSTSITDPRQHLVLEFLSKKQGQSYFQYQFDFYEKYEESLSARRCFACNQSQMIWANSPCKHLLWCHVCKSGVISAAGGFPHKCVMAQKYRKWN